MFKRRVCFKFEYQLLLLVVLLHLSSGIGNSGDSDNAVAVNYGASNTNNVDTGIVEEPPGIVEFYESNNTTETGIKENVLNETTTRNRTASLGVDNEEDILDEEYDYDYDDAIVTLYWPELGPTLAVFGATLVIGIIGNSLIIFTICRYRRMKSTTNVFLASLASADLLLIIICTPVKVAKLFSYTWAMGAFLCKSVHYLQNVSAICSVLTLTAMSIERYYAIVHPMKAKYMCTISQARKIVLGIWIASFLLAVPNLITQEHITVGDVTRRIGYLCVLDQVTELWRFHEVYMLLLILVIPTCIMVVAYGSISWEIWHVMQRRYDMTSGQALNGRGGVESFPLRYSKRQHNTTAAATTGSFRESLKKVNSIRTEEETSTVKQVIKMLVAVVVLFIICWAPLLILNVMFAYGYYPIDRATPAKYVRSAFTVMAYSNSCINPLVYGFMSKNFRESFYKALCRCCYKGSDVPNRHFSISQTRTTSVRFGRSVSVSTAPN